MMWWRACWAMSRLTILEIIRQKVWLVIFIVMLIMLLVLSGLEAVDEASRMKLSISAISGSINFVSTLLSILIVAATVTRDREQLVSLTLFAKPLPMSAYVCGRWLGVQIAVLAGIILLNAVGSVAVHLRASEPVQEMRAVQEAESWVHVDPYGETSIIDSERHTLAGSAKNLALRWHMSNIPAGDDDLTILIKGRMRSGDAAHTQAQVNVLAVTNDGNNQVYHLPLSEDSPYGAFYQDGNAVASQNIIMMRHKNSRENDLNQDYMRFILPRAYISSADSCDIQIIRKDGLASLSFHKDTACLLASYGGSFDGNMQFAGFIVLAQVGYLNAVAILCACFTSVGVTLLAGLSAFFGALLLNYIYEVAPVIKIPYFVDRFLHLLQVIIPDFNKFGVESLLSGGRSIGWSLVVDAWVYYGMFSLGFIIMAWLVMLRREL
ncbi:MAG: hypothetical protein HRU15_13550 [Planctomycetes bacterium]|nr:hypothetical protein [Planctomycetota bacterium]